LSGVCAFDVASQTPECGEEEHNCTDQSWCLEVLLETIEVTLSSDSGEENVMADGDDS